MRPAQSSCVTVCFLCFSNSFLFIISFFCFFLLFQCHIIQNGLSLPSTTLSPLKLDGLMNVGLDLRGPFVSQKYDTFGAMGNAILYTTLANYVGQKIHGDQSRERARTYKTCQLFSTTYRKKNDLGRDRLQTETTQHFQTDYCVVVDADHHRVNVEFGDYNIPKCLLFLARRVSVPHTQRGRYYSGNVAYF